MTKSKAIPIPVVTRDHEPTKAQIKAGNYQVKRRRFCGMDVSIENPAGSYRRGQDPGGATWETRMIYDYGYIRGTLGVDGDHVDCYLGPNEDAPMVYVVHQRRYGDWDKFDEDKCMMGFDCQDDAVTAYLKHYDDPRFLGPITAMPMAEFKEKVMATKGAPKMVKSTVPIPLILKAHVKQHTRTLPSGKVVTVREHDDARRAAEQKSGGGRKGAMQDLAARFERETGKRIEVAGNLMAGVEMRNMRRENGNPAGDPPTLEKEPMPFTKEQIAMYDRWERMRNPSSKFLFHTTPAKNLESIAEHGLIAGASARHEGVSGEGRVYLAANEEVAKYYGAENDVMLRVSKKHKFDDLEVDHLGGGEGAYSTGKPIPPDALEVKRGRKWVPLLSVVGDGDSLSKAHVTGHTRRLKSGKVVRVKPYDTDVVGRGKRGSGGGQMTMFIPADEHGEVPAVRVPVLRHPAPRPSKEEAMKKFVADSSKGKKVNRYYVTMIREGKDRPAFLAGPFDTHDEALGHVDAAREKAHEVDPWSEFDAFGTTGLTAEEHPPGVLNDHLGLGEKPMSKALRIVGARRIG